LSSEEGKAATSQIHVTSRPNGYSRPPPPVDDAPPVKGPEDYGFVSTKLLREANVGEFDLDELNELRRDPGFAQVKELLEPFSCSAKENDHATNEQFFNCIRLLAIQVGKPVDRSNAAGETASSAS